jgi:endonuclease/exonuclease/phosphatase family metal-dependent hydrolase
MPTKLRIATFNLENFDDKPGPPPTLAERIAVMRPQLLRVNADILCLQEVNGQEQPGQPRQLLALKRLFENTPYDQFQLVSTKTANGTDVYDERNLAIASRFPITEHRQYNQDPALGSIKPQYRKVTAIPPEPNAKDVQWERPIFYAKVDLGNNRTLHVINVHLKSKLPTSIAGQQINSNTWRTASGWAEGFFLSSMKRVGQALETRMLIDQLFDADEQALIVTCGDFNADADDVPMAAIRGDVEDTGNGRLATRVMVPCERTIPEPARYSLFHQGKGNMLDHLLVSRNLLTFYKGAEIHNELLHDESLAFADDKKYPESDHAPVVAEFELP